MGVEYKALFNEGSLRVVAGSFDDTPTAVGDGFSVSSSGSGVYVITFNRAYGTLISFTPTYYGTADSDVNVTTAYSASAGTISVTCGTAGAAGDLTSGEEVHFIAVFQE